jgi:hypothetical protein
MYRVENRVGRLVEVKFASPLNLEEVQQFVEDHRQIAKRIGGKYVGVVDLLEAHVFPAPVTDSLIQLLSAVAPRVERTAFLIGESAIFALQVERIIRSSNNPNRRAFRAAADLLQWLEEVLSLGEQVRLEHFVRDAGARAGG